MGVVRVTTWNVLHRVHAVNWKEAPVLAFPDERVRIAGISRRVATWLASGVDAVCLQEVSGDQLASLRRTVGAGVQIFEHLYPRLPSIRGEGGPVLDDATEYLVTLASSPAARKVGALTFDTDPGKGLLVVELADGIRIIDAHVSYGSRHHAQLASLVEAASQAPGGAILLGDFNAPAETVQAALGASFVLSDLRGQRATRTGTAEHPGSVIDHVAATRGAIAEATVLEDEALSDHAPLTATVRFG